jgi:hypothetical protein
VAKNLQIGEAGVLRVMSEMLIRGYNPYRPAVDDHGVDILVRGGVRVQVKTSQLNEVTKKYVNAGARTAVTKKIYQFGLRRESWDQRTRKVKRSARFYSQEVDFLIFVGLDESRFWIVPSFLVDGKDTTVMLGRKVPTSEEIHLLTQQGLGLKEIARRLGCGETTVWKRKQYDTLRAPWVRAIRMCEGRWDFLGISAPASMDEITMKFVEACEQQHAEVQQLEKLVK